MPRIPSSAMPSISSRSSLWSMSFCTATGRTRSSTNCADGVLDQALLVGELEIHRRQPIWTAPRRSPRLYHRKTLDRAVVLFTRDLRVRDNPALAAAAREAAEVVPLFVLDPAILDEPFGRSANRRRFLAESLADLDPRSGELGSRLVVRRGDTAAEVARLDPDAVYAAEDASGHAQAREDRLAARFDLRLASLDDGVAFDDLKTYRVFTPYFRAWSDVPLRAVEDAPTRLHAHASSPGRLPAVPASRSPEAAAGGEGAGRARLDWWLSDGLAALRSRRGRRRPRRRPHVAPQPVPPLRLRLRARVRPARPERRGRAANGSASSAGATSTRSSCMRFPQTSRTDLYDRAYARGGAGPPSTPGARAAPATRSSTRACASSRARAGCTTARDSSLPPSSSRISVSTGVMAPRGSRSCCSTGTSRRTAATGNGSPARVSTTRRAAGCSTRRCRPSAAILVATTFVATCPSSRTSRQRQIHEPWQLGGVDGYPRADRRPCRDGGSPPAPRRAAVALLTSPLGRPAGVQPSASLRLLTD